MSLMLYLNTFIDSKNEYYDYVNEFTYYLFIDLFSGFNYCFCFESK